MDGFIFSYSSDRLWVEVGWFNVLFYLNTVGQMFGNILIWYGVS